MNTIRIALLGFGNIGQELARIFIEKKDEWIKNFNCNYVVTAITTKSKGALVSESGIDLIKALKDIETNGKFSALNPQYANISNLDAIELEFVDVVVEITTLNVHSGQPAIALVKSALKSGKHVITTNKGPLAYAFKEIEKLSKDMNKFFLYEGTVMDGAPVFNLVRETLIGCEIKGFSGILNGTTNYILSEMTSGKSFESALSTAQKYGWAEADASMDIDGWDAAVKITALMNVLMGVDISPMQIERKGIADITPDDIERATASNNTIKLVCEGYIKDGKPFGRVAPVIVSKDSPLAHANGTTTTITFHTDFAGDITVEIKEPKITQTTYAVLIDLFTITREVFSVD